VSNKELIKDMLELQDSFNSSLDKNWKFKGWTWDTYMLVESAELIESLPFKHWKKMETDWGNVKVEAIDLLHFKMSKLLEEYSINKCVEIINEAYEKNCSFITEFSEDDMIMVVTSFAADGFKSQPLFDMFEILDMQMEDIYKSYIVKNCLNKVRQDNGYSEGTYIKNWNIMNHPEMEDNIVAYSIANELDCKAGMFEKLYVELSKVYREIKENK
jgi:dimeric dUTPase (all-alpha-NTP-PPase superfamily)